MWERELLKHGLMELDARELPHIPCQKLHQILNFDETSLSLDGSSINRGGRPAAYWFDPRLPQVGITMAKSAYSSTMIMGSNAYGEALLPHFHFTLSAQTEEGKMIKIECIRYMKNVRGEFGMGMSASFGVTFGMNEKGGMDMEEFAKYLCNAARGSNLLREGLVPMLSTSEIYLKTFSWSTPLQLCMWSTSQGAQNLSAPSRK